MSLMYGEKNKVMSEIHYQLSRNKMLLKFLHYDKADVDIVNAKELSREECKVIWDNNIFKEEKIPADITTDVKCYVCMDYGNKLYHQPKNQYFNGNTFAIRVVCHKEMRQCMNGDRVYAIEECIKNTFDNGEVGTVGRPILYSSEPFSLNNSEYGGVTIFIKFSDFNKGVL